MNIGDKIIGNILKFIAKLLDVILSGIEKVLEVLVELAKTILGFARIFFILGPFAIILLIMSGFIGVAISLAIFLFLGASLGKFLKYFKYMVTEYLYDRADYRLKGSKIRFPKLRDYGIYYQEMEYKRKMDAERKRQEETRQRFEDMFGNWEEFQRRQRQDYGQYYQSNNYGNQQEFMGSSGFKQKYEESCDILEIPYTASKEDIKVAYRKKAKQYHPDINREENATEMFQKINDAQAFLNDGNVDRYKNL